MVSRHPRIDGIPDAGEERLGFGSAPVARLAWMNEAGGGSGMVGRFGRCSLQQQETDREQQRANHGMSFLRRPWAGSGDVVFLEALTIYLL